MGALKLTYQNEKPTLKVVKGLFSNEEKSCAGVYRYGFNGQEKDNEIKGAGNSYDFGARMYDPRIGRWFKIDPLYRKYPSLSPYSAFANNPIIYIDTDGQDFEIVVDKVAKTITIQATFYTENEESTKRAQDAVNAIKTENGNYSLVTEEGEVYKINFALSVKEVEAGVSPIDAAANDPSGNSFDIVPTKSLDFPDGNGGEVIVDGFAEKGKFIQVVKKPRLTSPSKLDKHENLHAVGVSHRAIGKKGAKISIKVIGAILKFASESDKNNNISVEAKEENTLLNEKDKPKATISSTDKQPVDIKGKIIKTKKIKTKDTSKTKDSSTTTTSP